MCAVIGEARQNQLEQKCEVFALECEPRLALPLTASRPTAATSHSEAL